MSEDKVKVTPRGVSYFIALLIGLACFVALSEVFWHAAMDKAQREYALESTSIKEVIERNIIAGNEVVDIVATYLNAAPDGSADQFNLFTRDLLEKHQYIEAINYYIATEPGEGASFVLAYQNAGGNDHAAIPEDFYSLSEYKNVIDSGRRTNAVVPLMITDEHEHWKKYWLFKSLTPANPRLGPGESPVDGLAGGVVAILLSPRNLPDGAKINSNLSLSMHSNADNLLGQQQLYFTEQDAVEGLWRVDSLLEESIIQLPQYSIKLVISRDIYLSELDYRLIFTGVFLGFGILLLLFALIRAKEIQANELINRNLLIEKKVEEQTRELAVARNDALRASRMKSDFLAVMSHEIRTPLNAITGMAELLSETELSEEQKKYTGVFRKASDSLLALVNDILDLSKIESRQMVLENIAFDLVPLLDEAAEMYALKAETKNLDIVCNMSPELNRYRIGDPYRLRQILLNLINNALKFTDAGEILVSVDGDDASGDRLKFAVSDTGIGIPADKLDTIFADFAQADLSMTRQYGGTGLGLTIAKSLVEMMDGDIRVESVENKGATFLFSVVLQQQQKTDHIDRNLHNKSALIIDDHISNPLAIAALLEAKGMSAKILGGAAASSELAADSAIAADIVLVDSALLFPEGTALLEGLLSGKLPVLLMIGAAKINQHIVLAKAKGLSNFLIKPIKRDELIAGLEKMLLNKPAGVAGSEPSSEDREPVKATGKDILLVEDNPDNRLLVKAYLKSTPHTIQEAENGRLAVELFKNGKYDLVLMDVQMPVMNGHDATRAIRQWEQDQRLSPTPIISLTAHAIKEEIDKCMEAGCDSYLSKPVRKATLIQTIEELP